MASKLPLRMKPASFAIASRRPLSSLATSSICITNSSIASRPSPLLPQTAFQQVFRRTYADSPSPQAPQASLSPTPKPKKRFRIFRWLWRATYLSILAGLGYTSYTIWLSRNPNEQFEPDPSKKTLVVLGTWCFVWLMMTPYADKIRDRLGFCLFAQELGQ